VIRFLSFRAIAILVIAVWRFTAERCLHFLEEWCFLMQYSLLASCCLVAASCFNSYISLAYVSGDQLHPHGEDIVDGLGNNIVALAFFPLYIFVTTAIPFRSQLAVYFPVLAFLLILCTKNKDNMVFQSSIFKVTFIFRSAVIPIENCLRERILRRRYSAIRIVRTFSTRTSDILDTLMPPQVVEDIREDPMKALTVHEYKNATIAQSDLCGFTELASTRRPQEVVEIIGELFGRFDDLTDHFDVYKVETIGDAYVAGQAEEPLTPFVKPLYVVRFAVAMIEATHEWSRERGESVSCRVGVHTGRCVGGIIGVDMQRYHLFGELMSQLEVLESTAPRGGVQISQACRAALEADMRDGVEIVPSLHDARQLLTSKGEAHQFEDVGGRTSLVTATRSVLPARASTASRLQTGRSGEELV
jgi:class 3 adenylate cyclase